MNKTILCLIVLSLFIVGCNEVKQTKEVTTQPAQDAIDKQIAEPKPETTEATTKPETVKATTQQKAEEPPTKVDTSNYDINELPMYGGVEKTAAQKEADEKFIKNVENSGTSKEDASKEAIARGWEYYRQGDDRTAMKRLNQAWLLTPEDPLIFWGFADVLGVRNQSEQAVLMFEKALELEKKSKILEKKNSLANFYEDFEYELDRAYDDTHNESYFSRLKEIFKQATDLGDAGTGYCIHFYMLIGYHLHGDYVKEMNELEIVKSKEPYCLKN